MISIQYPWNVLIGLAVTMLLGFGVGCLVHHVQDTLGPLESPNPGLSRQWTQLTTHNTGGWWIGLLERPIFFAAFWISGAALVLGGWLLFKVAFYWQSTNFTTFPPSLRDEDEANYLVAKQLLGNNRAATALVGTAANIVLALIGVAVAKWIVL